MAFGQMNIRWQAVLVGVCFYVFTLILVSGLIIFVAGEEFGLFTDFVLTFLILFLVIYIVAKRTVGAEILHGFATGIGCALVQTLLNAIVGRFTLVGMGIQFTLFTVVGVVAGVVARLLSQGSRE